MALNCLTTHYAELWRECWDDAFASDAWTLDDERLAPDAFSRLTSTWRRDYPLRSDFARRQALIDRRDREEDYRVAWEAFDRRADVEK